eukprot:1802080-Pyramimonas_sp.AAC.1
MPRRLGDHTSVQRTRGSQHAGSRQRTIGWIAAQPRRLMQSGFISCRLGGTGLDRPLRQHLRL